MAWPLSQDYNESIQNPSSCFTDPELKQGEAVTNALGLPQPCSGNFADVYAVQAGQRKWAVKCFTRQIPGLQERYVQISQYLKQVQLPFMVDFSFLEKGIQVRGQWYPVLKMQWVEGFQLNTFVKDNVDKPQLLQTLAQLWLKVASRLREANLAHGDLQHGNVLLVPGSKAGSVGVKLVDYDGMCVPALELLKSMEVGHASFQHPQRLKEGTYGLQIDRFAHLVIYTALRGLVKGGRALWEKFDNGDNLLFTQRDFENPSRAAIFQELLRVNDPDLQKLVQTLATAAQSPIDQMPLLEQVVGTTPAAQRKSAAITANLAPSPAVVPQQAEDMFAAATAGNGSSVRQPTTRYKARKKPYLVLALLGGLALLGIGAGVAIIRSSGSPTKVELPPKPPTGETTHKEPPTNTFMTLTEIKRLEGHTDGIGWIAFSANGKRLLTGGGGTDFTVRLWDVPSGKQVQSFKGCNPCALSPDGKYAIFQTPELRDLRMCEADTGKEICRFSGHGDTVHALALSPDGRRLLTGGRDKTVRLWEVGTGRELRRYGGFTSWVRCICFSHDGLQFFSGSGDSFNKSDFCVRQWDVESTTPLRRFPEQSGEVPCVAAFPNGRYVAWGRADGVIQLWDLKQGRVVRQLEKHRAPVWQLAVAPDSRHMMSASEDNTFRLWDVETGEEVYRMDSAGRGICVAFAPDGRHVACGGQDKIVRIYELTRSASRSIPVGEIDRLTGHTGGATTVLFSKDGKRLISGAGDGTIRVWDLATDKEMLRLTGHTSGACRLILLQNENQLLSAGFDGTIRLWDLESGKETRRVGSHNDWIRGLVLTKDGKQAVSGSGGPRNDRAIQVWDISSGKELAQIGSHVANVVSLALTPDGRSILAGYDGGALILLDLRTGKEERRFIGHTGHIVKTIIASVGQFAVTCSTDHTVRIWNIASGKELFRFADHTDEVFALALSPNDERILSAGKNNDNAVRLWDVTSHRLLHTFTGHTGSVNDVAFSPDGRLAASASDDGSVRVWGLPN